MPSAPPPPVAVNAGQSMRDYIASIGDDELQQLILQKEAQYGNQYQANFQRSAQNQLLGVADTDSTGGYYGTLDLQEIAARRNAKIQNELTTGQTQFNIGQMGQYGGAANQAYLDANPGLKAALDRASVDFGGRQQSGYLNEAGRMAMADAMRGSLRADQVYAPGGSGYQAVGADQVLLGGVMTPERVAAERIAAERVAAGQVQAGNIASGTLGEQLYQQALRNQQSSQISRALQARGLQQATAPGQLTPEEMRAATQGSREQFAQAGRIGDNASIAGEAAARIGATRERSVQDLALAQAINQQLLGESQTGQQQATQILQSEIARQGQNVGNQLTSGQFNVDAALRASLANQQTGLQASTSNQQAMLQAALANQSAGMRGQEFNITNAQNVQQANQAANLQAALANQSAYGQNYQFGANQQMQANLANQQANYTANAANQAFDAQQQQQRYANLIGTTGMEQDMFGADRAYNAQLAGMYQNVGQGGQSLIGSNQNYLANANQTLGFNAAQGASPGPQLFDPNAGVNLALQNNANTANYNAAVYGANAAAEATKEASRNVASGAKTGAALNMLGVVGAAAVPFIF